MSARNPTTRLVQTVRKLRGRSLDELRLRGRQAMTAYLERVGVIGCDLAFSEALHEPVAPDALLTRVRARGTLPFAGLRARGRTVAALRTHCPDAEPDIIARADRARAGQFDLLGLRDLSFGTPIDWMADPVAGRRASPAHWSRIPFLDYTAVGDHKLVWELNRHQYLVTLGQAYWYTADERYASTVADHIAHWLDANPPKRGINWASSLEVAFRAISWCWAIDLLRESPALTARLLERIVASLAVHGRHLATYLSTYFSPNTHLTGEALGLYYIASAFPELESAAEWKCTGRTILLDQLARQVRDDGVYFEQSSYYHRYTADFYIHLLLMEGAGSEAARAIAPVLRRLLDHLMFITNPDGSFPLFGDDDGGRLLFLDPRRSDDCRPTLSTGAALFASGEYAGVAGPLSAETIWLAGADAAVSWAALSPHRPGRTSVGFPSSGFYVMRDGWNPSADVLLVDCGPHGTQNAGHAHADALAVTVAANGRPMLVDPGTFTYTASPTLRNQFRSSLAHNVLSIDGESSSRPTTAFMWANQARAHTRRWHTDDRIDVFDGTHDGYERLVEPAAYRRLIVFVKGAYWVVRDVVRSAGAHALAVTFQADASIDAEPRGAEGVRLVAPGRDRPSLDIVVSARTGAFAIEEGWVSRAYGTRARAPRCVYTLSGDRESVTSCLIPHSLRRDGWERTSDSTPDLVRLRGPDHVDVIAFDTTDASPIGLADARVEADVLWVRTRHGGDPVECVAVGLRWLDLTGIPPVRPTDPVEFAALEWRHDRWVVRRREAGRARS